MEDEQESETPFQDIVLQIVSAIIGLVLLAVVVIGSGVLAKLVNIAFTIGWNLIR